MVTRFQLISTVVACFLFLVCGLPCLIWPQAVRDWALKAAAMKLGPLSNPFLTWMRTRPAEHLWSIRMTGAIAILGVVLLVAFLTHAGKR
jgi:hypothetical protein